MGSIIAHDSTRTFEAPKTHRITANAQSTIEILHQAQGKDVWKKLSDTVGGFRNIADTRTVY